eukprot:CAMPEP_0178830600 /NCGR_PEP_ID=MMETSP0746-20121128/9006_1 /TAXON_ID=913974 /ORGANISM="Nitzschia punctata, Strain CCMP561" /LENGTH=815 /DNA_ID=CAMNT_0020492771 /DNA_START=59 /DNA_END=2506 /DNA_ORIENTATION=-
MNSPSSFESGGEEKPVDTHRKSVQFQHQDSPYLDDAKSTKSTKSSSSQASGRAGVKSRGMGMSHALSVKHQKLKENDEMPKFLFFPYSNGYKCWFGWTVIWAVLTIYFETYSIAFLPGGIGPRNSPANIVEYCFLTVFAMDILVSFNLAYEDESEDLVTDRKKIAWNYLRMWFWLDLIGVFPFYSVILEAKGLEDVDSRETRYLALVGLTRLVRLHRVVKCFEWMQYSDKISLMWYTMIRNFGGALVWTHLAACTMFYIARQQDFQDTWLEPGTETNFELYLTSLYWSIVTFTTVGYGDFSPVNSAEQVFGMIYMFVNMVMTSWIIGSITLLVVKNDEKNGEYRSNLQLLSEYANLHNFDKGLRKRLKTQLQLDFNNREVSDENVLQNFPRTLRRKVIRQLYYPTLSQTNLMLDVRQMFVDEFLTLCSVEIFGPGEDILQKTLISNDLYLLVDGTVKYTSSMSSSSDAYDAKGNSVNGGSLADSESAMNGGLAIWTEMDGGDFINDISFFTESPNQYTVRTVTVCKTLTMPKAIYKILVADHPGSVSVILQNLLTKAKKLAAAATIKASIPQKMGTLHENPENIDVNDVDLARSMASVQAEAALTSVEDLITMHINKLKDDNTTKFLFAASRSDLPTMRVMLSQGIDPNSADYDNRNAMMVAAMHGNHEAVSLLLEHHASPNLMDVHGTTALFEAVKGSHEKCMEVLLEHGAELCLSEDAAATKLCQCVFDGDIMLLTRLCKAGININAGDYDRRTAIHIAASEGNLAAIRALVAFGADVNVKDRWNQTISTEAKKANATKVLEFLETLDEYKGD